LFITIKAEQRQGSEERGRIDDQIPGCSPEFATGREDDGYKMKMDTKKIL
jgi:hypothetical protein